MKRIVICFGEVLWDLLPQGPRVGGAPLNVCYHLNKQGIDSKIISQVGNDPLGDDLLVAIADLKIDTIFCSVSMEYPTSRVDVALDELGKPSYTIVENVAWDYMPFNKDIAEAITLSDAFIFGSLVLRNFVSLNTLKSYLQCSNYTVMDINLRAPFYDSTVLKVFLTYVHCLKINDDELLLLGTWLGAGDLQEATCIEKILDIYSNIQDVILTKGADGACYYSRDKMVKVNSYSIEVTDTVGAGDAFLAGFLAYKLNGNSLEEALGFGTMLSAFVATKDGACPLYSDDDLVNFRNCQNNIR